MSIGANANLSLIDIYILSYDSNVLTSFKIVLKSKHIPASHDKLKQLQLK